MIKIRTEEFLERQPQPEVNHFHTPPRMERASGHGPFVYAMREYRWNERTGMSEKYRIVPVAVQLPDGRVTLLMSDPA